MDHNPSIGRQFSGPGTVNHSAAEYVRAYFWHTNTGAGYFSIFKRHIVGVYHHVAEHHLHCYLAEFDFRYNARMALSVRSIVGKRSTYRRLIGKPKGRTGV